MQALLSFLFFTALVGFFTWLIVRKDNCDSNDGFFLAGRSLSFPFIAGSLLLTNLSTEQLVGLNGQAFSNGLSVMAWEVVAVIGLILMALFFLPRFLKSGITTVPQYLEMRFGATTGTIANFIFLLAYMLILLPMVLYTGAQGLLNMLDIHALLGLPDMVLGVDSTYLTFVGIIVVIGIIGAVYALFGGLRTVVVSDTLNGIGLLSGGLMIVFFGLAFIGKMNDGGVVEGLNTIYGEIPEQFNSIGAMNQDVPFPALFSGILIINIFYWCTNQQIIQRTLGAKSLAEGQKGVLLTGLLKLLGPLYLVLPGIIGYYLYKNNVIEVGYKLDNKTLNSDVVYGLLVRQVLPAGLTGFFAAVMMGAILSSFNSALNSTCTIFSLGIYKKYINPEATEHKVVRASQYFGWL
ncbi:MAG: solute:sodium symporter family transporter, partial [Victivallaceae bacterium]